MGTVNTFIGNNLIIDFDIYNLWIYGLTVEECKYQILKRDFSLEDDVDETIVRNDILDYYYIFNKLEQYLQSPTRLSQQLLFQLSSEITDKLIEKYYEFNPSVMRELLGCKLTQRQRKDLDDISEKTGIKVRSCRRQFDNLKHISRTIEDMKGSLITNIRENFLLSPKLAEQYSAFVFLTSNHFEISKKKLNYLLLDDFIYCANQLIKNWSNSDLNDSSECDLSRDFLIDLKDLKIFVERDCIDDHRKLVINSIYTKHPQLFQIIDDCFKELTKSLIDIGYALNHSKDLKDLFLDLVEQFIEPCKEYGLNKNDVKIFLDEYKNTAYQIDDIKRESPSLLNVFDRYILTITNCILQMYHN